MEGTYYKEWSAVLDREMEFKVYGHGGVPVLALPARGGRFYDWENNGMPEAAARLLHEGKMQPSVATSAPGMPAMRMPTNVAELTVIGPGVISAMVIKSVNSPIVSQ